MCKSSHRCNMCAIFTTSDIHFLTDVQDTKKKLRQLCRSNELSNHLIKSTETTSNIPSFVIVISSLVEFSTRFLLNTGERSSNKSSRD